MSCENNTLDIRPVTLIIKKKLGDTLNFSVVFTDDDGAAVSQAAASSISYFFNGSSIAGLGTGVTVSTNTVTISKAIPGEAAGTYSHKLVIVLAGVTRTYFTGSVKIEA